MDLPIKCTGCMACYNFCKFGAISISQNEKGFYVPRIDESKCKKCGMCRKVCPEINNIKKEKYIDCYASWSNDSKVRFNSTSGGLFYEFARYVLKRNGVVIGAVFEKGRVCHKIIYSKNELPKLQGSKYVQSYIGDIYIKVKKELDDEKLVLFSGVACQISGLKRFLGRNYDNLVTVDVLCHGAPSPKIFDDYLKSKEITEISDIKFRFKKPGWTVFSMMINYKLNYKYCKDVSHDEFLRLFLTDYITNDVCSECKYTGADRISDITLADFWGYVSGKRNTKNDEKGISLVLVNSVIGKKMIDDISDRLVIFEKSFVEARNGNRCLIRPFKKNKNYMKFWEDYNKYGYEYCVKKYYSVSTTSLKRKLSLFINDHAYLIPKFLRKKIYKYKYTKKGVYYE